MDGFERLKVLVRPIECGLFRQIRLQKRTGGGKVLYGKVFVVEEVDEPHLSRLKVHFRNERAAP